MRLTSAGHGEWRRHARTAVVLLVAACAVLQAPAQPAAAAVLRSPAQPAAAAVGTTGRGAAEASLGVNLGGVVDWTAETPFVDAFRTSRTFVSQLTTCPGKRAFNCRPNVAGKGNWGLGPKLDVDEHGWVTGLGADQYVDTPIFTREGGQPQWPAGTGGQHYVVTWEGDGDIAFWGGGTEFNRTANRFEYEPGEGSTGRFLSITRTNPANYVRNIHVWMPGFEFTGAAQVFHPDYLASLAGMKTLRFMDWMHTNGSPYVTWDDYPSVNESTQTRAVAPELMVELANRVGADPWFTIPHQADDDFVRRFAEVVRDNLRPGLKAYVEYSNELWNSAGGFGQTQWVRARAMELKLADLDWVGGGRYQARRSVQIFRIWEDVFGAEAGTRIVKVLGLMVANLNLGRDMLAWRDEVTGDRAAGSYADAVAVAPYFGCADAWVPGDKHEYAPWDPPAVSRVKAGGVDRLLQACQHQIDTSTRKMIIDTKQLADEYGLAMVAYEGGQHLVVPDRSDTTLLSLFHAANRHQRMRDLYAHYLHQWQELGGGAFQLFLSAERMSVYGAWGLREFQGQPLSAAPKARAADEALQAWGQLPVRVAAPTVTRLSAQQGLAAGGATITITGANLASTTDVRFGGVGAPFRTEVSGTTTRLVVTTPAVVGGGVVDVTVTNPAGASAPGTPARFTYQPPPVLTAMSTSTASVVSGTAVTLTGANLTGAKVLVGTVPGQSVKVVSPTEVRFTAPARATAGTGGRHREHPVRRQRRGAGGPAHLPAARPADDRRPLRRQRAVAGGQHGAGQRDRLHRRDPGDDRRAHRDVHGALGHPDPGGVPGAAPRPVGQHVRQHARRHHPGSPGHRLPVHHHRDTGRHRPVRVQWSGRRTAHRPDQRSGPGLGEQGDAGRHVGAVHPDLRYAAQGHLSGANHHRGSKRAGHLPRRDQHGDRGRRVHVHAAARAHRRCAVGGPGADHRTRWFAVPTRHPLRGRPGCRPSPDTNGTPTTPAESDHPGAQAYHGRW